MCGEVGAGVAALDEARPIVADDHLLPLAVHVEAGLLLEESQSSLKHFRCSCVITTQVIDNVVRV